jgi:hypothetical protein
MELSMIYNWFSVHEGLAAAGRIPTAARVRDRISDIEVAILIFCGMISASAISFVRLGLRLPGHAIVIAMIPMALGMALVPRKFSGFIMGAGACGAALMFGAFGLVQNGAGSFVSMCLIGPVMDLALTKARSGWRLYFGMILAGISTNLLAFFSRSMSKLMGLDPGTRLFGEWWSQAIVTYSLCGALAGLIGALCFFHLRNRRSEDGTSL